MSIRVRVITDPLNDSKKRITMALKVDPEIIQAFKLDRIATANAPYYIDNLLTGTQLPTDQFRRVTALVPAGDERSDAQGAVSHLEMLQAASRLPADELGLFRTRDGEWALAYPPLNSCIESVRDILRGLLDQANVHHVTPTDESRKAITLLVKYLKYAERAISKDITEESSNPDPVPLGVPRHVAENLGSNLIHLAVIGFCSQNHFSVESGESFLGQQVEIASPKFRKGERVEFTEYPISSGRRYFTITNPHPIKINPGGADAISYGFEIKHGYYGMGRAGAAEDSLAPLRPLESLSDDDLLQVCMNLGHPDATAEIHQAIEILKDSGKLPKLEVLAAILSSEERREHLEINSSDTRGTRSRGRPPGPYERADNYGKLFAYLIKNGASVEGNMVESDIPVMHELLTHSYPGSSIQNVISALLDRYNNDVKSIPEHPLLVLSVLAQEPSSGTKQLFEMYGEQFYVDFEHCHHTKQFRQGLVALFERLVEAGADVNAATRYGRSEVTPIEMAYERCQGLVGRLIELGAAVPESLYQTILNTSVRTLGKEPNLGLLNTYAQQNPDKLNHLLQAQLSDLARAHPEHIIFLLDAGAKVSDADFNRAFGAAIEITGQGVRSCKVSPFLLAILEVEYAKHRGDDPAERATQVLASLMMGDPAVWSRNNVPCVSKVQEKLHSEAVGYLLSRGAQVDDELVVSLKQYVSILEDNSGRGSRDVRIAFGDIIPTLLIAHATERIESDPQWIAKDDQLFRAITFFGNSHAKQGKNIPSRYVHFLLEKGAQVSDETMKVIKSIQKKSGSERGSWSCMDHWLTPNDKFDVAAEVGARYAAQKLGTMDSEEIARLVQSQRKPMRLPKPCANSISGITRRLTDMGALDVEVQAGKPVTFKAPQGWKIVETDHSMYKELVNANGERVLYIFDKPSVGLFGGGGDRETRL
jgi:hypothetical protein